MKRKLNKKIKAACITLGSMGGVTIFVTMAYELIHLIPEKLHATIVGVLLVAAALFFIFFLIYKYVLGVID